MADHSVPLHSWGDSGRRVSPLAGWRDRFAELPAAIQLAERPFLVQLNVRVEPGGAAAAALTTVIGGPLPTQPSSWRRQGSLELLWLGPDEWLLVADADQDGGAERLEARLAAAIGEHDAAITDVSAQRTAIDLTGPGSAQVLASGCALDLDPRHAPAGSCLQTLLARTGVIIVVRDDTATSYRLLVRSSFADYLAAWLVDAALGID